MIIAGLTNGVRPLFGRRFGRRSNERDDAQRQIVALASTRFERCELSCADSISMHSSNARYSACAVGSSRRQQRASAPMTAAPRPIRARPVGPPPCLRWSARYREAASGAVCAGSNSAAGAGQEIFRIYTRHLFPVGQLGRDSVNRPSTRRFMTRCHRTRPSNRLPASLLARGLRERFPNSEGQSSGCPASRAARARCATVDQRPCAQSRGVTERDETLNIRARADGSFWRFLPLCNGTFQPTPNRCSALRSDRPREAG